MATAQILNLLAVAPSSSRVVLTLLVLVVGSVVLLRWMSPKHDPREPPVIPQTIPFVGHLIGIFRGGDNYIGYLRKKYAVPAMTLEVFGKSMYIILDPELVTAVHRHPKTLDFNTVMLQAYQRVGDVDAATMEIVSRDLNNDQGIPTFAGDTHNIVNTTLAPGASLNETNAQVMRFLDARIHRTIHAGKPVQLHHWIRNLFSLSATDGIYGPANPLAADPSLVAAFWEWEADFMLLMLDIFPGVTARKGKRAREAYKKAFTKYWRDCGYEGAAKLIHGRRLVSDKFGLSLDRLAQWDLAIVLALLVNAVPSCFWLTAHVFADEKLLADLRAEVAPLITLTTATKPGPPTAGPPTAAPDPTTTTATFNITKFNQACPLFVSAYQEVLRLNGSVSTTKMVISDTVLGERYLLKKGGIVQIPGGVIHGDATIWGADADEFNASRFLHVRHAESRFPGAFRAFGGGANICPGRHFARTEILAFVGMLISACDVVPTTAAEGEPAAWSLPQKELGKGLNIRKPVGDVEVTVRYRPGWENVRWVYETGP